MLLVAARHPRRPRSLSFLAFLIAFVGSGLLIFARVSAMLSEREAMRQRIQQAAVAPVTSSIRAGGFPTPKARAAAMRAVTGVLSACKAGRYDRAFLETTPRMQATLGSPSFLRTLMTSAYPELISYKTLEFGHGRAALDGKTMGIRVDVVTDDNKTTEQVAILAKEPDGKYHLDGFLDFRGQGR